MFVELLNKKTFSTFVHQTQHADKRLQPFKQIPVTGHYNNIVHYEQFMCIKVRKHIIVMSKCAVISRFT